MTEGTFTPPKREKKEKVSKKKGGTTEIEKKDQVRLCKKCENL